MYVIVPSGALLSPEGHLKEQVTTFMTNNVYNTTEATSIIFIYLPFWVLVKKQIKKRRGKTNGKEDEEGEGRKETTSRELRTMAGPVEEEEGEGEEEEELEAVGAGPPQNWYSLKQNDRITSTQATMLCRVMQFPSNGVEQHRTSEDHTQSVHRTPREIHFK
jgi:hypothetical protein